jgi:hypothetical protein
MFTEQELLELIAIDDRFIRDCSQYCYADGIKMGHESKSRWEQILLAVRAEKSIGQPRLNNTHSEQP